MPSGTSDYVPNETTRAHFRYWHVEAMLNQAADLLDRAVREQNDYHAAMQANKRLEIEFNRLSSSFATMEKRFRPDPHDDYKSEWKMLGYDLAAINRAKDALENATNGAKAWLNNIAVSNHQLEGWSANATIKQIDATIEMYNKPKIEQLIGIAEREYQLKEEDKNTVRDEIVTLTAAKESGKELDFKGIADRIERRVVQDFYDAYDRLTVASDGLRDLYGYTDRLPAIPQNSTDENSVDPVDDASLNRVALWNRKALQWLAAFQQLDQGSTYVVSLRTVLHQQTFTDLLGQPTFQATFNPPAGAFAGLSYVRLRGVSVVVVGTSQAKGPWRGVLTVPSIGLTWYQNDSGGPVPGSNLPQQDIPKCVFGRIDLSSSPRPPEVCGLISLFNASPIAAPNTHFTIEINGQTGTSDDFAGLSDIYIEFNLASRRNAGA
jgi:hypothetical protein